MRFLLLSLLGIAAAALSAEPVYPLWDGQESIAAYAERVHLPPSKTLELGNGVKLELVLIPAGTFIMGSSDPETPRVGQTMVGVSLFLLSLMLFLLLRRVRSKQTRVQFSMRFLLFGSLITSLGLWGALRWHAAVQHPVVDPDERPAHSVTLTQPFYLGKYEVTQEQYRIVTGLSPARNKGKDNPVESVTWEDAQTFCQKFGRRTNLPVQLPSEAEWEYACRAGTSTLYHSGDGEVALARVGWYRTNSSDTTHPVGQKEPNAFGLFDMHGNVWEWCADWCGKYSAGPAVNPTGTVNVGFRTLRGGSWYVLPEFCRSADRFIHAPDRCDDSKGFRVALRITPDTR